MNPLPSLFIRANELREKLRLFSAHDLAERTGSILLVDDTEFDRYKLDFIGRPIVFAHPSMNFMDLDGNLLPEYLQLLLLYYFVTADGCSPSGQYVSFADLPGGRIYSQAFQGYTGNDVVKAFGENIEVFKFACQRAGGESVDLADATYNFQILPKVFVQIVYWLGDEDFPSTCRILFDSTSTHYLPIDGCAIAGSNLARKIIKYRSTG